MHTDRAGLLYLACHIVIIVSTVFKEVLGPLLLTPEVQLFKQLNVLGEVMNKDDCDHIISDANTQQIVENDADSVIKFCKKILNKKSSLGRLFRIIRAHNHLPW